MLERMFRWILLTAFAAALMLVAFFVSAEPAWEGIVVHHSASSFGTVEDIDRWHKERGWDGIGYHFVIYRDGSVHKGRNIATMGAHAKGRNQTYIGVCLIGEDVFTVAQKKNLAALVSTLNQQYPIKSVERHHEVCPGDGLGKEYFK